jgi:hypothetical protein
VYLPAKEVYPSPDISFTKTALNDQSILLIPHNPLFNRDISDAELNSKVAGYNWHNKIIMMVRYCFFSHEIPIFIKDYISS